MNPFAKLTDDQLFGAHYALRLIRTSPLVRGAALAMLDEQIADCEADARPECDALASHDSRALAQEIDQYLDQAYDYGFRAGAKYGRPDA